MANIPLAKIPQSAQTGSTYVPVPVGAIRAPNYRRAGAMIAGSANLLKRDTLPVSAFGGNGEGLKAFGEAGARIANIFGNFAESMAKAADEGNFAAADRLVTEARAAHQVETSTMPETEWANVWQEKYLPKLNEQIGKMRMTPAGRARLSAWWENQQGNANAAISISANKQFIQNATQESMAYAERERLNGNHENAFGIVGRLAASGMISSGEKERILLGWEKEDKAKANETLWANSIADVQAYYTDTERPLEGLSQEIDEAIASKSWETQSFPQYNGKPQELLRLQGVIKSEERSALLARKRDAMEAVANNHFTDAEQIRETYGKILPKTQVDDIVSAFNMTPEQAEARLAMQPDIIRMIEQFRPQDDPNGVVEVNLIKAIHTQPAGFQQQLLDRLREQKRGSKPAASSYVDDRLKLAEQQFKFGEFGKWRADKDGNPLDVDNEWAPARIAMSKRTDALRAWAKQNPQDASDPIKVNDAMNNIMTKFYEDDKAAGRKSTKPTMLISPGEVRERIRSSQSPTSGGQSSAGGVSQSLVDWMKKEEGFNPNAYLDGKQISIGYGTRGKAGEKLTEEQATERLQSELSGHARRVDAAAKKYGVTLTENQRDALISFDFNTGEVFTVMQEKDPERIAERMKLYVNARGKKKGVLTHRRNQELKVFSEG